ncbi:hypothetical protein BJY01DRAFT_245606 [Aspergillus pseudoustus]|uniref:Mid2 domain-containing protein n=1 Tax=Aspergillus pseudoustus TaxID=1810923 RepID=A0ABR4KCY4_9EURO
MASPRLDDPFTTDAALSSKFSPDTTTQEDRSNGFYQATTYWGPNRKSITMVISTLVSIPPSTFELSSSEPTPETVTVYPPAPAHTTRNTSDDQGGGGGGLSTGAKAGIGVGVEIAALLLLIAGLLLCFRRRKVKGVEEDGAQGEDSPVKEEMKSMPPEMDGADWPVFELPVMEETPPFVLESGMKEMFELESA